MLSQCKRIARAIYRCHPLFLYPATMGLSGSSMCVCKRRVYYRTDGKLPSIVHNVQCALLKRQQSTWPNLHAQVAAPPLGGDLWRLPRHHIPGAPTSRQHCDIYAFVRVGRRHINGVRVPKATVRSWCSNPPVHGARIVAEVVGDEATFNEWRAEMAGMAGRIKVHPLPPCCLIAPPHPRPLLLSARLHCFVKGHVLHP